jgi:hypothetical protein
MKAFNLKVASRVCFGVVATDAVLMALGHWFSDSTWIISPWWIVNFPGFPLLYMLLPLMPISRAGIVCSMGCMGLFSALFWSAVAGYAFRHRYAAQQVARLCEKCGHQIR